MGLEEAGGRGAESSRAAGTMHSERLKEPLVQLGGAKHNQSTAAE